MIDRPEIVKAPVTTISSSAAEVTTRPVRSVPNRTASSVLAPAARASTMRDMRNTS